MTKKLNLKKLQQAAQDDYLKDQAKKKAIVEQSVKRVRSFYSKVSDGAINMDLS
jgi:hypothetical protein|tara:strand:+ start:3073 stop:3234 length:162 start_codon:yes stop_codon:yes gene_type:complete